MPSWKIVLAVLTVLTLGVAVTLFVVYQNTPVPTEAQTDAQKEETVISFSDGTPLARIGMHRESVPLTKVPKHVQDAVLAAEDRGFWTEPGISPSGVGRALVKTATGGDVEGGSTITQQLARNYFQGLSQERTISRKLKEIMISMRIPEKYDKAKVLELYLNTVYFGRQSYGIQAASRAYFHKSIDKVNVAEAAVLAAMIQRPNYFVLFGSANNPAKKALLFRWNYVLDGLVKMKKLDQGERAKITFPTSIQKIWSDVKGGSQTGYLEARVKAELRKLGVDDYETGGLKIKTTFDRKLQDYTATAVEQIKREHNLGKEIHFGLTAINPKTGGVVAAYGGPAFQKQQFDDSFQGAVQPGSSFKPIVLATALAQNYSLQTTMDGSYRRVINGTAFTNDSQAENGVFNLKQMTAQSINTAYVDLGQKVGLDKVADMAVQMGIPENTPNLKGGFTSLPLGVIDATSLTMASVYTTFAAEGKHRESHVIESITDKFGHPYKKNGKVFKLPGTKASTVFSEGVARDATSAMQAVVTEGTGKFASLGARPVAGKTGTTDQNKSAWFVGYTPELTTSVAMWRQKGGQRLSLKGVGGYNQIYGGTVPAKLFKLFMLKALDGKDITQFGPPANGGTIAPWAVPKETPKPTVSPTVSPSPTMCPPDQKREGDECVPKTADPTPTTTQPSSTPAKVPCNQANLPLGCDPEKPPSEPPPQWWCMRGDHMETHPSCRQGPGGPNGN